MWDTFNGEGRAATGPALDMGWKFPTSVVGWLTPDEGETLSQLARNKDVLEIGSYCGRSTISMAQTARRVYSLDWHKGCPGHPPVEGGTLLNLLANLELYGIENVIVLFGSTMEVGRVLQPASFGLVFVDGGHDTESVREDVRLADRVLEPKGILAFHDWGEIESSVTDRLGKYEEAGQTDSLRLFVRRS